MGPPKEHAMEIGGNSDPKSMLDSSIGCLATFPLSLVLDSGHA